MAGITAISRAHGIWIFGLLSALLLIGSAASAQERARSGAAMDHSHLPIAAPTGAPAPALSLQLSPDAMSGYNLRLILENFSMMPPPFGLSDMADMMRDSTDKNGVIEGHAHLYINGTKIQRLYGRDAHLPANLFRSGINQITVSINNHGHMYWTFDERQVLATLFINPASEQIVAHRFESFPAVN